MDKNEALLAIIENNIQYDDSIHNHPNQDLVRTYDYCFEGGVLEIFNDRTFKNKIDQYLNEQEIIHITKYIITTSFMSAVLHISGNKSGRDKAVHSCANLISELGPIDEVVFLKLVEIERFWRSRIKEHKAIPKEAMSNKAGCLGVLILPTLLLFFILML